MTQTIEQARAAYATRVVETVLAEKAVSGPYRSYARQFGAMIHGTGLGQAMAFARSKAKSNGKANDKEKAWHALYTHFSDWLTGGGAAQNTVTPKPLRPAFAQGAAPAAKHDALKGITGGDVATYMLATAEAIALAVWIKRLAEALIDPEAEGGTTP